MVDVKKSVSRERGALLCVFDRPCCFCAPVLESTKRSVVCVMLSLCAVCDRSVAISRCKGLWIVSDFTTFWTNFHRLFFSNASFGCVESGYGSNDPDVFRNRFFFAMVSRIVLPLPSYSSLCWLCHYKHVMKRRSGVCADRIGSESPRRREPMAKLDVPLR